MKPFLKQARYLVEAFFLLLILLIFRLLPLDAASAVGGMLARLIGPFLRAHRTAHRNLTHIFPQYSDRQIRDILTRMWDNLGRSAAEYPHLSSKLLLRRITVEGGEYFYDMREHLPAILISAHYANWELAPLMAVTYGVPILFIYRRANNPYAERLIQWMRGSYRGMMAAKGRESVQEMIKAIRERKAIGLLADQKQSEGQLLPLMGYPARSATAAAKLAIKFQIPVLMVQIVRTHGVHFHVTAYPPMHFSPDMSPEEAMGQIHAMYESWIRQHPEQWFWVHNRWNWNEIKK